MINHNQFIQDLENQLVMRGLPANKAKEEAEKAADILVPQSNEQEDGK